VESSYVVWALSKEVKYACVLGDLVGVDRVFELNKGVPRAAGFPSDVQFKMNPDFPNDTVLTDSLINADRLIVGSMRLKKFLESAVPKHMEYLPVTIVDHKGKTASRDYFIVHPVSPVNCLEAEKSGAKYSRIVKGKIQSIERLVIDPGRIDPDRQLWRLDGFFDVVLAHRNLAERITSEGFTGIRWIELSNYPEH
jgi:hypothetical protein